MTLIQAAAGKKQRLPVGAPPFPHQRRLRPLHQRMPGAQTGKFQLTAAYHAVAKQGRAQRTLAQRGKQGPVRGRRLHGHDGVAKHGRSVITTQQHFTFPHAARAVQTDDGGLVAQATCRFLMQTLHAKCLAMRFQLGRQRTATREPVAQGRRRIDGVHVRMPLRLP
ncbi:hypothetical protein D3C81_1605780 [compost metagenome]